MGAVLRPGFELPHPGGRCSVRPSARRDQPGPAPEQTSRSDPFWCRHPEEAGVIERDDLRARWGSDRHRLLRDINPHVEAPLKPQRLEAFILAFGDNL